MSYPQTPLTAETVQGVLRELNYVYPLNFCKTLAGKLNERIEREAAPKACPACNSWGSVSTGIDEAPSTLCEVCEGSGSLPR